MKKEEILEKSKSENLWSNERSKDMAINSENYAAKIGMFLLLIIIFWKWAHHIPYNDLASIFFVQFGVSIIYKYKNKTESKLYLVAGILMLFGSSIFLLDFFVNGVR
ncbi:DUF6442 family protein [Clostridium bowmanii]|uniref:DUF6442 family protein n=1 Tax=Clostridium bowmanii TaxID=132925 RepID=UPI001C0BE410|nr:DUF6442 family protein [Clostridium bowmanii]MBU3191564.1 hypothetical protein [Clostridium bowmanii]MCA1072405.1 DUF6442 family protein [Clostridium bowmanii]